MNMRDSDKKNELTCNALGLTRDPSVCFYFPHQLNYCHHIKKPEPITLDHQEVFCLTQNHGDCVVFKQEKTKHLPPEILGEEQNHVIIPRVRKRWLFLPGLVILAGLLTLFALNPSWLFKETSPPAWQGYNATIHLSSEPAISLTPNQINLLFLLPPQQKQATRQPTSESSSRITPTAGPGFGTPIGVSQQYILHQVKSGESLHYLANLYQTDASIISATNSLVEGIPIQKNQILIIKPGAAEDRDIIPLAAVLIQQESSLAAIAKGYSTSVEILIDLNELGSSDTIPAGRWLIVPAP